MDSKASSAISYSPSSSAASPSSASASMGSGEVTSRSFGRPLRAIQEFLDLGDGGRELLLLCFEEVDVARRGVPVHVRDAAPRGRDGEGEMLAIEQVHGRSLVHG